MAAGLQLGGQTEPSLRVLRQCRVVLVDQLEEHIGSLLEQLLLRDVFTRDDREEVLCEGGPRAQVRKTLDIVDCKGEEAAAEFRLLCSRLKEPGPVKQQQPDNYSKLIQRHKQTLKRRSEYMLYYNTRHGEKILFSEHYINLLLMKGHRSLELKKHEIVAFGQQRISLQCHAFEQKVIKSTDLFSDTAGSRPAKKILVTGVAGIGKTVLVQKILSDFGNNQAHLGFDFVIHLTFRDLNLIKQPISLRELLLQKNGHLAKEMDTILSNEDKLLIVLDGFDEFRHYRECEVEEFVTEPDEKEEVVKVLSSLMQSELLPEASVLLTSRPTAISHIPIGCIDYFVLLTGFSMAEIEDFFLRYFEEQTLALKMFNFVKANNPLLTLCYIPAFCYIVCTVLNDSDGFSSGTPKTMTDVYTQYLVALLRSHSRPRLGLPHANAERSEQLSETISSLGRIAYVKLLSHETLFYGHSAEIQQLANSDLISAFLDKTLAQEPGCMEDVYSFAHFTIQEFFAALYYTLGDQLSMDVLDPSTDIGQEMSFGYLDLFKRFLSGLLAERNWNLLSRYLLLERSQKAEAYLPGLLTEIENFCENGSHILNQLHCFFEQQNDSLAKQIHAKVLRVNISNNTLCPMDYTVLKYFLNLMDGEISELDLTATNITSESLRDLKPYLLRCENLWIGENNLDTEAVHVLAEILQSTSKLLILGIGWTHITDDKMLILTQAMKTNQTMTEIWMEGNQVTYQGLSPFTDPNSFTSLDKVVAIWNNISQEETDTLNSTFGDSRGSH
ncbi:la-related protein 7 isoform X1 [Brienomyrus brachyistius]|uniref:la-related protein 7 isoform X1 n=1 Tax=Brienomyrus brachyistius TaxID=42636 RepID=UPI0020B2A444|nr:la-related protein 7 isoform X1 [Brienomyrus brachyistius]